MKGTLLRWLPLALLIAAFILFYYAGFQHYLSFDYLKQHRAALLDWTNTHYATAVICYMFIYIIAVAISIPGATFLTLTGGFLFGIWWGTLYVVLSATIGSLGVFTAVRLVFDSWAAERAASWTAKMREGFQRGAIQYLLVLRLVPLFPFWAVNIAAALLGVSTLIFTLTTFIGIIPGSFVYVLLGNGLGYLFDRNETPNLHIIFEPAILFPLLGLAVLSLLPSLYQWLKGKIK